MDWHDRILESWPLRWIVTFMITFFLSALLLRTWSFAFNLTLMLISAVIVYNLREFITNSRAGVTAKHDFVGWLILTVGVSGILAGLMNTLFMLGKL
jgi:Protein of unknown function (DUF2929).